MSRPLQWAMRNHSRNHSAEPYIDHFVSLVLGHIDREYPNKLDHVINDDVQVRGPRQLHPIFYGSFDWHSCVHGHWLLVRALRNYPQLASSSQLIEKLDARLTADAVRGEVEYLGQKLRGTFERTYGWAWLLKMAAELRLAADGVSGGTDGAQVTPAVRQACARWETTMKPLTDAFEDRFIKYLPKATYPIRVGTHNNSAFALALTLDYAQAAKRDALRDRVVAKARAWYSKDANYPAWEPDGTDFISPGLMEAECMRRVLPADEFARWFEAFFPGFAAGKQEPATLFVPAIVSDRTDGQITHLDGLNLSRAWCWRSLSRVLPPASEKDGRRAMAERAVQTHLDASLAHVTGDYMGEHWLATFALLAMTE